MNARVGSDEPALTAQGQQRTVEEDPVKNT